MARFRGNYLIGSASYTAIDERLAENDKLEFYSYFRHISPAFLHFHLFAYNRFNSN